MDDGVERDSGEIVSVDDGVVSDGDDIVSDDCLINLVIPESA
jgi:hypothetical protein